LDTGFLIDEALKAKLLKCPDLPSPPGVAIRILEIGNDPQADLARIAEVISLDPALTTKILRIANSTFYSGQRKVENLRQAIVLFGLNGTLTLALSFSLVQAHGRRDNAGIDYNAFWRRSLAAANACRQLGKRVGLGNMEDLFLAGLLQDIGMLALEQAMPEVYIGQENLQSDHRALYAFEQATLEVDHATVGAWLMARWNLPERWVTAVAASHNPGVARDPVHQTLAYCVAVSSDLADFWWSENPEATLARAAERAEKWLPDARETLADVIEAVTQEVEQTATMFDIDLGDTSLMLSLMAQARDILIVRSLHSQLQAESLSQTTQSLESRTRELEEQTRRDGLTGIYNRTHLDAVLDEELQAAVAQRWPLALALIDLDHFKQVNDSYGHLAGDKVLRQAAQLLATCSRNSDTAARFGGEEFVLIMPGTDLQGAQVVCDRLLTAFRETQHNISDAKATVVTISIGLVVQSEATGFSDTEAFIQAADNALYAAKLGGRDRIIVYDEQQSAPPESHPVA
jgi:diguanylate cyclase (GGDEF)-like protein